MKNSNNTIQWIAGILSLVLVGLFIATGITAMKNSSSHDLVSEEPIPSYIDSYQIQETTHAQSPSKEVPSTTSTTTTTTTPKKSSTPARRVSERYIDLAKPSTTKLNDAGLMPGTNIIVVRDKTSEKVVSDSCTVAFSLPKENGGYIAVTAGHCGEVGSEVYSVPTTQYFNSAEKLGFISHVSSPGDFEGAGDWGVIDLDGNAHHPRNAAQVPLRVDLGTREPGQRLCKDGARTGYGCGDKGEDDVLVNLGGFYGEGFSGNNERVTGVLDQVYLCSLPGDSGSPIYDEEGIVGILSSSSASDEEVTQGSCNSTGESKSYYSPSSDVIAQIEKSVPGVGITSSPSGRSS